MPTTTISLTAVARTLTGDRTRTVFGQVMGLVALTCGCAALGAYIGRNMAGGGGHRVLHRRVRVHLRSPIRHPARPRAARDRAAVRAWACCSAWSSRPCSTTTPRPTRRSLYQAVGATGGFVALLGAVGYATRRDLSVYYRFFFFALIALIVFGLIAAVRRASRTRT